MEVITQFKETLQKQNLSQRTIECYMYDIKGFKAWIDDFYQKDVCFKDSTYNDMRAYREYLLKIKKHQVASVNRRLQSIKKFYQWLVPLSDDHPTIKVHQLRRSKPKKPTCLSQQDINNLLRVAGRSSHGLCIRNYALIQLLLNTGLRVGEVAMLRFGDFVLYERSGFVKITGEAGHVSRHVPLNSVVRRAINAYFDERGPMDSRRHIDLELNRTLQEFGPIELLHVG